MYKVIQKIHQMKTGEGGSLTRKHAHGPIGVHKTSTNIRKC